MHLVLFYDNRMILRTPVKDKVEFFQLLNKLEREIDGQADCCLFDNSHVLFQRKLNYIPLTILNPEDKKSYSFVYFLENLHKFPKDLWMLYFNYNNLKYLRNHGFF